LEKKRQQGQRIEEIDALRGFAAVLVMLSHYTANYDYFHQLRRSLGFNFPIGYYGVYLFFVISGFVIVLTLHRCRTGLDFAVSRFSRIFPAYWGALLITFAALHLLRASEPPGVFQLMVNFTMLQRFFGVQHLDLVYWTLNVELSFYCWMLLVFKLGWLDKIEKLIPFVLFFQATVELYARLSSHVFSQGIDVVFLLEYVHLFCAGMLFYEAREKGWTKVRLLLLFWCFLNQFMVRYRELPFLLPNSWGPPMVALVFLLMFFVVRGDFRWLAWAPLVFLGTISYTFYLLHDRIGAAIMENVAALGFSRWPGFLAAVSTIILLATLLTFLIEKPAMTWIRRQYKQRKTLEAK
jgi:peptidoglycan/LPS O-acetylase OafA/YrhL